MHAIVYFLLISWCCFCFFLCSLLLPFVLSVIVGIAFHVACSFCVGFLYVVLSFHVFVVPIQLLFVVIEVCISMVIVFLHLLLVWLLSCCFLCCCSSLPCYLSHTLLCYPSLQFNFGVCVSSFGNVYILFFSFLTYSLP